MEKRQKNWKMPGLAALLAVVAMILTSACGPYSVSIAPPTATVSSGQSQQFTASTQQSTGGDQFQWSLPTSCTGTTCGTLLTATGNCPAQTTCGPLTADGATITYVAPTAGPAPPTITLTVNAMDNNKPTPDTAMATATITPIVVSVSVSPPTLSFQPGGTPQPFTATVLVNGAPNTKGVTWSLSLIGADCTSATLPCGSLSNITSTTVSYTPPLPSVVGAAEQVVLTATPVEDTFITGSAVLSISAGTGTPLTLNVTPSTPPPIAAGTTATTMFTASGTGSSQGVTWALSQGGGTCLPAACGSLPTTTSTTANYLPPTSVTASTTVTLTATAVAAPSLTASATITVTPAQTTPLMLSINPSATTVSAGATSTTVFTASLSGTGSSQGVTWALSQGGGTCLPAACGSLPTTTSTTADYLPPTSVTASTTVTLTATAVAALNPTALATITVTPGQAQSAFLRYIFEVGNSTISSYAVVSTTGQMRSLNYVAGPTTGSTTPPPTAAINPNGTAVYLIFNPIVSNRELFILNVEPNGVLQQSPSSPTTLSADYANMAPDPLGRFLYASDQTGGTIGVFALDSNGNPTGSPTTAATVSGAAQMVIDSKGANLFVLTSGGQVAMYSIDGTTGALTLIGTPATAGSSNQFLTVTPNAQTLYVLSNTSIYAFSVASSGPAAGLTPVTGSPFTGQLGTSTSAAQAAVDPSGTHLYVTAEDVDGLFGFSIASSGAITALAAANSAVGSSPTQINIDPTGSFVYVANQNDAWVYSLNGATGALTPTSQIRTRSSGSAQLLSVGSKQLTFTPTALYVANSASNNISQFSIDSSSGTLANPGLVAAGTTPKAVTVLPSGAFAYATNSGSGNLSAYSISGGVLSPLGTAVTTGSGPAWLTSDLSGSFLYSANQGASDLWSFSIGSSGALTSGEAQINTANTAPVFVTTEATGQYLYTANSGAGNIDEFSILSPQGSLSLLATISSQGLGPDWIAVDPSGRYAYVANLTSGDLGNYTITEGVGTLVSNGLQPTLVVGHGSGLSSVVVEPSGRYVFVSDFVGSEIFSYTINSADGTLAFNTGGELGTTPGTGPVALAVDISGQYLYCANSGTNDISIFKINLSNGTLSQIGTATVKTGGTTPAGLATTGTIN
jgi:6-phosphogluconolactonase (cycloisomerase 2 family)